MTQVDEIVGQCTRAWRRLGVPADERGVMASELLDDLQEAADSGDSPLALVGGDPRLFAESWAREKHVIRPRWRVGSTTVAALASTVPGVAFLAVMPLVSTSDWAVDMLIRLDEGQRARTNLSCGTCPAYWDPPTLLLLAWYLVGALLVVGGALVGVSAWLRRCNDPVCPETLRSIGTIGVGVNLVVLAALGYWNLSRRGTWIGNGGWVVVLLASVIASLAVARGVAVHRARRQGRARPVSLTLSVPPTASA